MSNCGCQQPCSPCNNNCPDDGEILSVEILDAEDCNTNCCGKKCNDNCGINIQSTSDCLTVDTSECGVVKLTPTCPPRVLAGDNVTVDVAPSAAEGYSLDYTVNAECEDNKVSACEGDEYPGMLYDKLQAGTGISITPVGCNTNNAKVRIDFDTSVIPDCPEIPEIVIHNNSSVISTSVGGSEGHDIYISDKDAKPYYAKLVLAEGSDRIKTLPTNSTDTWALRGTHSTASWETVYLKNLAVKNGSIKITKKGLYHVGFSGSAECGSGVHAFRVQLWSSADEAASSTKTLIESRYSAPIGDQPFEVPNFPGAKIHYVSGVSGGGESSPASASYSDYEFKIDTPLRGPATDIEWTQREANGKSASLGSYVSRMPVVGSTIVELDVGDWVGIGVKLSSEVRYTGDLLGKMDDYTAHFALLCKNSVRSGGVNTGAECGLSFFADLIHPLYS